MGRRSRRSSTTTPDAFFQPPPRTLAPLFRDLASPQVGPLSEIEDRRTYHPLDDFRPAMEIGGTHTTPRVVKKSFKRQLPFGLQFAVPEKTIICVRRKTRKEVLHAKRKTGRGKGRRYPTKNWFSKIGC